MCIMSRSQYSSAWRITFAYEVYKDIAYIMYVIL